MGGRLASVVVAIAVALPATAGSIEVEAGNLPLFLDFSVSPRKLPRAKPRPVRVHIADKYETGDGSHVPALEELELELDRHLALDVAGIPVCSGGTLNERREVLEGCEDAVVAKGTIEVEVAYPEAPIVTVPCTLTIYNRGRKPGGADFAGYAYFPAPITGAVFIPIKARKSGQGRYRWRARFEIPKIAGGYGSIVSYSAQFRKRIFSATCADGKLVARALSNFVDGTRLRETAIRTCAVAETDVRK